MNFEHFCFYPNIIKTRCFLNKEQFFILEERISTATTKQCKNELALLDEKIVIEEYKAQNQLTREEVFQFLLHTARKEPNLMIHSFVQRAILSDDKIEIYYNFTNKQLPDGAPDECCRVSSNELKALIYKDCKEKNDNSPKGSDSYRLVRMTGFAPLAARPARQLSIAAFAVKFVIIQLP